MKILPAAILAVAILLAPVLFYVIPMVSVGPAGEETFDGGLIDSGARIEIEMLRQRIEILEDKVSALEARPMAVPTESGDYTGPTGEMPDDGENMLLNYYASVVSIPERRAMNQGLTVATPNYLEAKLGRPRDVLTDQCESMTNEKLRSMLFVEDVGPIKVQMLRPAIDSITEVFEKIRETDQDLYDRISTAGSLCVRRIRGTMDRLSSHSFGLSVDLNIDGYLDTLGDGYTQVGLTILADFFREAGWIWGAGFGREDSMHFEVSVELLEKWLAEGLI